MYARLCGCKFDGQCSAADRASDERLVQLGDRLQRHGPVGAAGQQKNLLGTIGERMLDLRGVPVKCSWGITRVLSWPIQDIRLLVFVCSRINRPFITPAHSDHQHYCNTIARLVRRIYPPPDPPSICYTPYNIGNDNIV